MKKYLSELQLILGWMKYYIAYILNMARRKWIKLALFLYV